MDRYNNINIKRLRRHPYDKNLVRTLSTVIYPRIPRKSTDIYIMSNASDRLDLLAAHYYNGDPTMYWIIAVANGLGKGNFSVPPGIQLRIPTEIDPILQDFYNLNQERL